MPNWPQLQTIVFKYEGLDVAVKNYAVHQSFEDPGSASQQSECNDPAPHYPACLGDHKAGPAR